jgi:hypothetical protein
VIGGVDAVTPGDDGGDPREAYDLVTSTMQRTLTRLGNERTVPIVG